MKKKCFYLFAAASMFMVACDSSGSENGAAPIEEHSTADKAVEGENIESSTTSSNSAASPGIGGAVNTHAAAADTTEHVQE